MTHSSPDSDQPPFLIELSPNTHSLLLAVALPSLPNHHPEQATRSHAESQPLKQLLITPLEAVLHGHTYPFPTPIDPRSIHPSVVSSSSSSPSSSCSSDLVLRASALVTTDSTARPSIPLRAAQYWPMSDLLLVDFLGRSSSIQCATCQCTLIAQGFTNVRTLPSSSWHDLVECWACHETNVVMPTSGHLGVDSNATVWVGAAHLVVHTSALCASTIEWEQAVGLEPGQGVTGPADVKGKCTGCQATVAVRPKHVRDAIHLVKSRVLATCTLGGSGAAPRTWSLAKVRAAMLLAEVLDQVTLHAAHKIVLVDLDAPARQVLEMWTISWNCQVRTRHMVAKRAAKVLYRLPLESDMHKQVKSVDDLPNGYGLVVVPDVHVLVNMLDEVNLDLPPSQRQVTMKPGDRPWRASYLTA